MRLGGSAVSGYQAGLSASLKEAEITIEGSQKLPEFSLLGGPLHSLGSRLGLVRGKTNTIPLGVALGVLLWTVAVVLAVVEGLSGRIFSLAMIAGHLRLLAGIPLFFVCEAWIAPQFTSFVRTIVDAGIVPAASLPHLESKIKSTARWRDAWLPEVVCLLIAVLLSALAPRLSFSGLTTGANSTFAQDQITMTGVWYQTVCLPLFRFLILRWLWRLGLWWGLLWRLARLKLHLVPTHPDLAAGLGGLETVHTHFIPLVLAISIVNAASFAEELSVGATPFEAIYPEVPVILMVDALLFLGPLFVFTCKLWVCRVKRGGEYRTFAAHYVADFDTKWLRSDNPKETLLGTSDLQSLADLANSFNVVRTMRIVPFGSRLVVNMTITALVPLFPLLLFKYPLSYLTEKVARMLLGF